MNMADETISEKCETLYNKLNTFVASVISRDVTPKISNLNTEVWGSDTQTGNSRIDTLNTNFNNLDSSITTMESDINNVESDVSNLQTSVNSLNTSITNTYHWDYQNKQTTSQVTYDKDGVVVNAYRRGNTVTVRVRADIKYVNMGSDNASLSLATLPSGYRPPIQLYSLNAIYPYYSMFRYGSVNTDGKIYLNVKGASSVQTVNAWIDLAFTYVTTDDAPSQ